MRKINLNSLVQAKNKLTNSGFATFKAHYGFDLKDDEIKDLENFIAILNMHNCEAGDFEGFYVGYKIPQIGKEFDLLRFGENYIINIEQKSTSTDEKIIKQLKRNKYYLKCIDKEVHYFTFVSKTKTLFTLNEKDTLETVDLARLIKLLKSQNFDGTKEANDFFSPSDYLVSPFNSTERFIEAEYFLTQQQETVQAQIIKLIGAQEEARFISLTGAAGTGKTLLVYDIARRVKENGQKALIIHCGILNEGQNTLRKKGWDIQPIKEYNDCIFSNYDLVIVDEAQRLTKLQIEEICKKIISNNGICIFSYDKLQTLATHEANVDVIKEIPSKYLVISHKLSEKIRSNKEISNFIKSLFETRNDLEVTKGNNIELRYFGDSETAKSFLGSLDREKWEILNYTPSRYITEQHQQYSINDCNNAHKVIGQEFDNVAVAIDKHFNYTDEGNLDYQEKSYYSADKMLFQNITRVKKRLLVVIIANEKLLDRCRNYYTGAFKSIYVPMSAVDVSLNYQRSYWQFSMSQKALGLLWSSKEVALNIDLANAMGFNYAYFEMSQQFKSILELTSRNCI